MSGQKSTQNISTSSKAAVTTTTTSSDAIYPKRRIAQNFLLIWIDADTGESKKDCQNTLVQLRSVVDNVNIFAQLDACIDFLTEVKDEKAFLIIGGTIGQQIIPLIHDIPQLDTVYIFCHIKFRHEQWAKDWAKVQGVHTEITSICESLQQAVAQCNQNSIAVSFVSMGEDTSSQNLNQLEPSFMYTQIFKEILLDLEYDHQSTKDLALYCRQLYNDNIRELNIISEFEREYRSKSPIWWYTRECFTYQMLNRALRTLESDTIIKMGFFIHDLHHQIQELYHKQIGSYHEKPVIVFRGQGLSTADFEKLLKTKGGLMSFNNFLSTSKIRDVSLRFAKGALGKTDMVGILFKISTNPSVSSIPFATIKEVSYFHTEEEILFSMHTVFRISEINKIDKNSSLYQVDLKLTADDDQQLRILTDRIREEVAGATNWERLGNLLLAIGQLDKTAQPYNVLLDQTSNENEIALYYNQLGHVKDKQGDYEKAIWYNEKALEIRKKILPPNHLGFATSYANIASVYHHIGEYAKALSFYEKAFEIQQKTLPTNHYLSAVSLNNIAVVYYDMGQYSKALMSCEKALVIYQNTLPLNHPKLATFYDNIASMYHHMKQYLKSLSFYERALEIRQKTLPLDHPDFGISYNNIASLYYTMAEYSKALSFYKSALEIFQKALPSNHPTLATYYSNICVVYDRMGEYSKALSFYEKAFEIQQKILPPNHPSLAISYNNIAGVYYNMREYSKALSFYQRALNIFQSSLPSNHPNIKLVQANIEHSKNNL